MTSEVQVIAPGTRCRLTHGDRAEALVLAVTIRGAGPSSYEISWWSNGSRQTACVEPHEIESLSTNQPQTIGFAGGK